MEPKIATNRSRLIVNMARIAFSLTSLLLLILRLPPYRSLDTKPVSITHLPTAEGIAPGSETAGSIHSITSEGQASSPAVPEAPSNQGGEMAAGFGLPAQLTIPSIHVDAAVVYVGTTPQGAMDVPKGPDDVAWFELGPRPGQSGTAVIAGHEGWKDGIPAVFDDLHTLKRGDTIYVQDDKGTTSAFVVRELGTYEEGRDASGVFDSDDGRSHLNLITCEGVWNKTTKSYSDRLVVFTDKQAE